MKWERDQFYIDSGTKGRVVGDEGCGSGVVVFVDIIVLWWCFVLLGLSGLLGIGSTESRCFHGVCMWT